MKRDPGVVRKHKTNNIDAGRKRLLAGARDEKVNEITVLSQQHTCTTYTVFSQKKIDDTLSL